MTRRAPWWHSAIHSTSGSPYFSSQQQARTVPRDGGKDGRWRLSSTFFCGLVLWLLSLSIDMRRRGMLQRHRKRATLMEREKPLCKLAKVRNMGVELGFCYWWAFVIDYCSKSKQIILHMIIYTEQKLVNYPIVIGIRWLGDKRIQSILIITMWFSFIRCSPLERGGLLWLNPPGRHPQVSECYKVSPTDIPSKRPTGRRTHHLLQKLPPSSGSKITPEEIKYFLEATLQQDGILCRTRKAVEYPAPASSVISLNIDLLDPRHIFLPCIYYQPPFTLFHRQRDRHLQLGWSQFLAFTADLWNRGQVIERAIPSAGASNLTKCASY